jgi:hypothetical protein
MDGNELEKITDLIGLRLHPSIKYICGLLVSKANGNSFISFRKSKRFLLYISIRGGGFCRSGDV